MRKPWENISDRVERISLRSMFRMRFDRAPKTKARHAGLSNSRARADALLGRIGLPAVPVAAMPMVAAPVMTAPAPVPVPAHFGGQLAGIVLHCRGSTGSAQRQRLGALGRRSNREKSRDGGKAQNSLHVHKYPPWVQDVECRAIVPACVTN